MSTQQPAEKLIPFLALGGQFKSKHIASNAIGERHLKERIITGTTHATPGTTVNVAHGLGYAPGIRFVRKGNGYITAVDATNITIASAVASQALEIVVLEFE